MFPSPDAAINPENSGGPIVYEKNGELAAVAVAGLSKDMSEGMNFGIKASTVRQFLTSTGLPTKWSRRSKSMSKIELAKIAQKQTLMVMCNR